jgi:hypothetical protein
MKSANAIKNYRKSGVAEGRDLQCAIRVPRSCRPTTSTITQRILVETPTSPLSFRVSKGGPWNRRSLEVGRPSGPNEPWRGSAAFPSFREQNWLHRPVAARC